MRIHLISDLHLGSRPYTLHVPAGTDVVVFGGDFDSLLGHEGRIRYVLNQLGDTHAIMVLGNHDFYGGTLKQTLRDWNEFLTQYPNVHLLENTSVIYKGVRFVGGTLWTDFRLYEPDMHQSEAISNAMRFITDFSAIRDEDDPYARVLPEAMIARHEACASTIEWATEQEGPTVVVTHFMPSPRSIHEKWRGSFGRPCNPYFCSNLEHLMRGNVKLWLHGHTHDQADYHVGDVRVVCNPRGYNSKENPLFDSKLVIDL